MNEKHHRLIEELKQKDTEVFENLSAFYDKDLLMILGEMANLLNIAKFARMQGQTRLAGLICDQVAHMGVPLARLAKKPPEHVSMDLIAISRARHGEIAGGGS